MITGRTPVCELVVPSKQRTIVKFAWWPTECRGHVIRWLEPLVHTEECAATFDGVEWWRESPLDKPYPLNPTP